MQIESFVNVWDALCDTPGEAAVMTLRSELLMALQARVQSWGMDADDAARRLGVARPRLDELMRGGINGFDLEALVALAIGAGLSVRVEIAEAS
jgi:predicted XRE-type DNA-binding protein